MPRLVVLAALALMAGAPAAFPTPAAASVAAIVTDTGDGSDADPGDGTCATDTAVCTLRAAIDELNAEGEGGTIDFAISGDGVHTITPATELPAITVPVEVDGLSQPGALAPTADDPAELRIALDGSTASPATGLPETHALDLEAGAEGSVVRGLVVGDFRGFAVRVAADGVRVVASHLGIAADGVTATANRAGGVGIAGAEGTVVGGDAAADRNLLSGNALGAGVRDAGGSGTQVIGNLIGPDETGAAQPQIGMGMVSSNGAGVVLESAEGARIADNLVSGNDGGGVTIAGGGSNVLTGNTVGLDAAGTGLLRNGLDGVRITDSPANEIGGPEDGEGNLVSGNAVEGIVVVGADAIGNRVLGNLVGTDGSGTKGADADKNMLGNRSYGISVWGAPDTVVGAPGAGNVVGLNGWSRQVDGAGIVVTGAGASGTVLQGNVVGLDKEGSGANHLGNVGDGIRLADAPGVEIGGPDAGEGNVVADQGIGMMRCCDLVGIGGSGIELDGSSVGTVVQGNKIGTDATGTVSIGNVGHGIQIGPGATDTVIGGTTPGAGNVVSGDVGGVGGASMGIATAGARTRIAGNLIGTDATGLLPLGNQKCGIVVYASGDGTIVGGPSAAERNVVGDNGVDGIEVAADDVLVQGNFFGVGADGTTALPNAAAGVAVLDGTGAEVVDNVLSGNAQYGVSVRGATRTLVRRNRIGTDPSGTIAVANGVGGVDVSDNAAETTIGGLLAQDANLVSGNGGHGVIIQADGVQILGNRIGTDAAGTAALPNGTVGVILRGSNGVVGDEGGYGNVIRFNPGNGISVNPASAGHAITANSIDDNGQLAIDLASWDDNGDPVLGVTPNDPRDADIGGNQLQNFPVLSHAERAGGATVIRGSLSSLPDETFSVDLYTSPQADPSGHGEARRFLGSTEVRTGQDGRAAFALRVPEELKGVVTATATIQYGDTSELSRAITVVDAPDEDDGGGGSDGDGDAGGDAAPAAVAPPVTAITPPASEPRVANDPLRRRLVTALVGGMRTSGRAARIGALLRTGAYRAAFDAPEAGGVRIDWWLLPARAARAGAPRRPVLVARGKRSFTKAGRIRVPVALTRRGRRLLRTTRGPLRLTARSRFSGATQKLDAQRRVTLRR